MKNNIFNSFTTCVLHSFSFYEVSLFFLFLRLGFGCFCALDSESSDRVPVQTLPWPGASAALITVVATVVGTALPKLLWPPDYKSDAEKVHCNLNAKR